MATYHNQSGNVEGTSEPDIFVYDLPLAGNAIVNGKAGADRLVVNRSAEGRSTFSVDDSANSGSFQGSVVYGDFRIPLASPYLLYSQIEDVSFVGSDFDDLFNLIVGNASLNLLVDFDGGEGNDRLYLDYGAVTGGLSFVVDDETIVSNYGNFANFESFSIRGGAGDDVIRTGAGNDYISASEGSDELFAGSGNDVIESHSGGDSIDGGVGDDLLSADYSSSSGGLLVDLGETISVSNGTTAVNIERVNLTTGSGNDVFFVTRYGVGRITAGAGYDTLLHRIGASVHQDFTVIGAASSLSGTVRTTGIGVEDSTAFSEVELVHFEGGSASDTFFLSGAFEANAISFDGGGNINHLRADFSALAGGSTFTMEPDGTIVSNRGQFANIDWVWLTGGTGDDVFTTLDGPDQLSGGGGNDRLEAGGGYDVLTGGAGDDQLYGGAGDDDLSGDGGSDKLYGGEGADTLRGGANSDELDGGTGADTMRGGTGNDVYHVDDTGDTSEENPGEGTDTVRTALATYVLAANVENLTATSDTAHDFRGNSGNNVITAGGGNDTFRLQDGGDDNAIGGGGNDWFLLLGALAGADSIEGGAGTDELTLQGDYSAGVALGAVTGIELMVLLPGNDNRFGAPGTQSYSYSITTTDQNVAAGVQMNVDANRLRAGENLVFDGSAETDGSFYIFAGKGIDTLTGGAKNDLFLFRGPGNFTGADTVKGGAGFDELALRGDYTGANKVVFGAATITGIEAIVVVSGHDLRYGKFAGDYSFDLTLNEANVAPGQVMIIDAGTLRSGEKLTFDGSAETDGGRFTMFGGRGNDILTGGSGADSIRGGFGADVMKGNGGADTFVFRDAAESPNGTPDRILDFLSGTDKIDLSKIDANSLVGGDQAFTWIGSNAFGGTGAASAGQLRAYQSGGDWFIQGDTNGDGNVDLVIQVTGAMVVQSDFML